jgi:hypothetical protein
MCLYLLATFDCRSCLRELNALARDFAAFLLLLPGMLLASLLVGTSAVLVFPVKWVAGSGVRMHSMCASYAGLIRSGVDAYAEMNGRQPQQGERRPAPARGPVPMSMPERMVLQVPLAAAAGHILLVEHPRGTFTVEVPPDVPPGGSFLVELPALPRQARPPGDTFASWLQTADGFTSGYFRTCVAELTCCCLPFFLVLVACAPFLLALQLLLPTLTAFIDGGRAGVLPHNRLLREWWPPVLLAVHAADRRSSTVAFGQPGRMLLWGCGDPVLASARADAARGAGEADTGQKHRQAPVELV